MNRNRYRCIELQPTDHHHLNACSCSTLLITPWVHLKSAARASLSHASHCLGFVKMTLGPYTLGWAFTFLLCFALFNGAWGDCGPPPDKPNTNPIKERSGTTGQTFDYKCDRSNSYYETPGKSTTITCQADGTWTNIEDFCSRACGLPKRISYAEPEPGALNENIFLPNATVSYRCRSGYTPVHGKKSLLTCLEDYTWSEPEVFCQRRSCENPGKVENGNMEATDFLFGSRVTYACNEGYRLVKEPNFRDCQANGIWSNSLPKCVAVICPAPELPADGKYHPQKDEYNYLDYVIFSCQKPLHVVGNASISCTATGKWSLDSPTCKAVNCPNPDVKDSRRLSGSIGPYTLDSAISFKCDKGFILRGSSLISCNIDSQWEPAIPQCERISCGNPGTIQNGQISAPNFYVDSKANYTCNEGFAFPLTSSRNYTICQENGAWSDLTLVCTATCKENFHIPPFALLNETSTIYYNGTVVRFKCKPGFTSNGKENTITCRDHSWSGHKEFCTRISCGDPGKIKNGNVSASDYLFGSRAIYTCEKGYVMNTTQNFTECQADGTWSTAIGCKERETYGDREQEDKPEECKNCTDMEQGDKPEDASKSEGIGIGEIVGICCGIIITAGVAAGVGYLLCKHLSKKRKTGKLHPQIPSVQYSHCTA